jgi:hypothetical protein
MRAFKDNPEHWRKRADQMRELAEKLPDSKRRILLRMADEYEELARRAYERIAKETGG